MKEMDEVKDFCHLKKKSIRRARSRMDFFFFFLKDP